MKIKISARCLFLILFASTVFIAGTFSLALAHCDTLDGPVIQDARKALDSKDVTPVLKWVKQKEEKAVRAAFAKALGARGKKNESAAENSFFAALVKIHRAGEGASFTGLKPAGEIEPVILEADKALAGGSADELIKRVTSDIAAGIQTRYERAQAAFKHKDESVELGRAFVEAYVEYTHYIEKIQQDAAGKGAHDQHGNAPKHLSGHGDDAHHHGH